MRGTSWAVLAAVLLTSPAASRAADDVLAGNWKFKIPIEEGLRPVWLVQLKQADGKWTGKVLAKRSEETLSASVGEVSVADGLLRLALTIDKTPTSFEGRIPAEKGKSILGTLVTRGQLHRVEMEPTALTRLDAYDLAKEELAKATTAQEVFSTALPLLAQAADRKAKPEEVRSWAEKAYKAAEPYGPRQQRDIALRIADLLSDAAGMAEIAVSYARRAERTLDPKDSGGTQWRVLRTLAEALAKAGKADEAKEVEARLKKVPAVNTTPFAGRQAKSDRPVVVELFTGAQCLPCAAADMAFDALGRTYKPADVILLQYHVHNPGPDPLSNPDTEARGELYGRFVQKTPSVLFNGRFDPDTQGGGSLELAQSVYQDYREVIDLLLEKPGPKIKLTAGAARKGNKVEVVAEAATAEEMTDKVRLRLVLVEDEVAYSGANRVSPHRHVVRAMPGGPNGVLLKDKAAKQAVTVDLDEVRKGLEKYLAEWAKENAPFPGKAPAIELKNLRLVALLQSDRTGEILQATQVDVKGAE